MMTLRLVPPLPEAAVPVQPAPRPYVDPFQRERRFVLTCEQVEWFTRILDGELHESAGDRLRAAAYTRTTYLDTDDLRYYRSCGAVIARRLRVREYPDLADGFTRQSFLELKQSTGSVRSKVRIGAPISVLAEIIASPTKLEDVCGRQDGDLIALRTILEELRKGRFAPRVATWYLRACLAETPALRVTLDRELTFLRPRALGDSTGKPETSDIVARGPGHVLEVKYVGALPEWIARSLSRLKEASSFSKFKLGMLAMARDRNMGRFADRTTSAPAMALVASSG